jgi:hypothetical protein
MSQNWDKPVTEAQFWVEWSALHVAAHHGFDSWNKLLSHVGVDWHKPRIYEAYLSHCKLMSSPLMEALE